MNLGRVEWMIESSLMVSLSISENQNKKLCWDVIKAANKHKTKERRGSARAQLCEDRLKRALDSPHRIRYKHSLLSCMFVCVFVKKRTMFFKKI